MVYGSESLHKKDKGFVKSIGLKRQLAYSERTADAGAISHEKSLEKKEVAKGVDKLKKERYKKERLKGNSKAESLRNAGYSDMTSKHRASDLGVVISGEKELMEEIKASDISVDWVVNKLNTELQSIHAKTSDRVRILELLGKYLNMFRDAQATSVSIFTGDMLKDLPPIDVSKDIPIVNEEEAKLT